ncbi:MAG: hypothetical protein HY303_19325, partial [Candidatus Wallbacteria bacterium]|nr:hypothetical protein [Candidatus Wallbacteria bacterium]
MRRGFYLVEALIGAMLLAAGFLPIAYMWWTTNHETVMDQMELQATTLASELLEQVRAVAVGRVGVPNLMIMPVPNEFPSFPDWVDIDGRLALEGPGFPLFRPSSPLKEESSRMWLQPTQPGFRRYVQIFEAPLLLGGAYARSPYLG